MYKITNANIKEWAKNYDGEPFDAILCDPPYELGFMGKSWDSSGIAFDLEMWQDLLRILKPGAHLLAFSGSRTYHRMAVAIEDAGFEIRDMIEWVYGSGFPKSLNIGKAVDKIQGNERQSETVKGKIFTGSNNNINGESGEYEVTKGTSEWEGYGTALKPAHEPCVLARKPIEGTVANNVLKHGTGGLAIDKCRITAEPELAKNWERKAPAGFRDSPDTLYGKGEIKENMSDYTPSGRFPSNLIHDGSDEVEAVFPQTTSGGGNKNSKDTSNSFLGTGHGGVGTKTDWKVDSGSASRFFYCAKSSKSERNAGLEGFEVKASGSLNFRNPSASGRSEDAPSVEAMGGLTAPKANHHPTVKPLSLTKYLATLIKPPTGGRLLVPFSGSGSEMIGALQAGWEYVEGVELTEEYIPIAEARIKYWLEKI